MAKQIRKPEWIPVSQAADSLASRIGSYAAAKLELAQRIMDGQLSVAADKVQAGPKGLAQDVESTDGLVGAFPKVRPPLPIVTSIPLQRKNVSSPAVGTKPTKKNRVRLAPEFWCMSCDRQRDIDSWDWSCGDFVVTSPSNSRHKGYTYVARGAVVDRWEIDFLFLGSSGSASVEKLAADAEKAISTRLWDWEPVLVELIAAAESPDGLVGKFGLDKRGGQAKLEAHMKQRFDQLEGKAPSEGEIRKRARAIRIALTIRKSL